MLGLRLGRGARFEAGRNTCFSADRFPRRVEQARRAASRRSRIGSCAYRVDLSAAAAAAVSAGLSVLRRLQLEMVRPHGLPFHSNRPELQCLLCDPVSTRHERAR
jgi:hypothetical protein